MSSGVLQAALAYAMWGLFPLYFQLVSAVAPLEIVLHRALWSLAFVLVLLAVLGRWTWLRDIARSPRTVGIFASSALLLCANWLVYVWAVNNGRVVESSLGYFITPLVNVLLGYFVLRERPRRAQWWALAIAAAGVLWLTLSTGSLPWVGLVLAASFGIYGLLRKTAPLGALEGLALETLLLAPPAAGLLAWRASHGGSALGGGDAALLGLLALAGPLTALPLLLFAAGARRLPMTTLGVLQYIGPTIQFALGVWLFHEPFAGARLAGFMLIWAALLIYTAEGWMSMRRQALREIPPHWQNREPASAEPAMHKVVVERQIEIARPIEVVRRQFVDMEHHCTGNVHPGLEVANLRPAGQGCTFTGRRRVLGLLQEDEIEVTSLPDGNSTLRSVAGTNAGLLITQMFEATGPQSTLVSIKVEMPVAGAMKLLRPLVQAGLARDTESALRQDKADLEQRYMLPA